MIGDLYFRSDRVIGFRASNTHPIANYLLEVSLNIELNKGVVYRKYLYTLSSYINKHTFTNRQRAPVVKVTKTANIGFANTNHKLIANVVDDGYITSGGVEALLDMINSSDNESKELGYQIFINLINNYLNE